MAQQRLMRFDPETGNSNPYPSHAAQYRDWHGQVAWLVNPWSGIDRNAHDIGSDPFGLLIGDGSPYIRAQDTSSNATLAAA